MTSVLSMIFLVFQRSSLFFEGRTQAIIRNHFLKYDIVVRSRVKIITMDMFSSYSDLAKQLFPYTKIVLDCFLNLRYYISKLRLKQFSEQFYSNTLDLIRAMSHMRVQIINQFEREHHGYKTIKRY